MQSTRLGVSQIQMVNAPSIAVVVEMGKGIKYNINLSIPLTIHMIFVCSFNGFYAIPLLRIESYFSAFH